MLVKFDKAKMNELLTDEIREQLNTFLTSDGNDLLLNSNKFITLYNNLYSEYRFDYNRYLTALFLLADIPFYIYIKTIPTKAFTLLPITDIIVPDNITILRPDAFSECGTLENITLPETLEQIGYDAFKDCYNLKTIIFNGSKETWKSIFGIEYLPEDIEVRFKK